MIHFLIGVLLVTWCSIGNANEQIRVDLPGGAAMEFTWIEPGQFKMGDADLNDVPHLVTLSKGFYLGTYEVTKAQWRSVVGAEPWAGSQDDPNQPATLVSWEDVQGYIHQLNQAAGDSLYRLPTEAEWEYACRAGTTTRWFFGEEEAQLGHYGWYADNASLLGITNPVPVGGKLANPWGLYGMYGNVSEWVQDWYGTYPAEAQIDPLGPESGSFRVTRGGHWIDYARAARSASRSSHSPSSRETVIGVRLLRVGPGPSGSTPVLPQSWGGLRGR